MSDRHQKGWTSGALDGIVKMTIACFFNKILFIPGCHTPI